MVAKMIKSYESIKKLLRKYFISESDIDYLLRSGYVRYASSSESYADKRFAFTSEGIQTFGNLIPTINGKITVLKYAYKFLEGTTEFINTVAIMSNKYSTPIEVTFKDEYNTNKFIYWTNIEDADENSELNAMDGKSVEIILLGTMCKMILQQRDKDESTKPVNNDLNNFFKQNQTALLVGLVVTFFILAMSKGKIFKKR